MQMRSKEQLAWIQWLRLLAAAAVVLMHTAADGWQSLEPQSPSWLWLTGYDSLVRWPVPVFMMVTGALFLGRQTALKRMLTDYIPKAAGAFFFWSAAYLLFSRWLGEEIANPAQRLLTGHYHLWYLPWLAGLYLVIPFLQKIVTDEALEKQLLCLSFGFGIAVPWLADLLALVKPEWSGAVGAAENAVNYTFFFDCIFFPLLGYRLSRWELSEKARKGLYLLGLLGVAVTGIATVWATNLTGRANSLFFDFKAPNNVLAAAALFVFCREKCGKLPRWAEVCARCSFGIYLIHPMVIETLEHRGLSVLRGNPGWTVPVTAAAVFLISLALTAGIRKIPAAGKYLV